MVTGPQRRREKMSKESKSDNQFEYFNEIRIRDTILNCKVDGMETTSWALHRIDQHLESIAKSLSIIAGAQAQIAMFESEEK
jgi:hypothetical protein